MDKYIVEGGIRIKGEVNLRASKNTVLPMLAAALLATQGKTILHNIPAIADIFTMVKLLKKLGVEVEHDLSEHSITISAQQITDNETPYNLVRKMRASFLLLGPLLARLGKGKISLPGGCTIGARPVNYHLAGFKRLGVKIHEEHGYIEATTDGLRGNTVYFDRPSHTGTENIIMSAVLAEGDTTIINAACDPEVTDLANMLNKMGANIVGAGLPVVRIKGVKALKAVEYRPIGDRLEAGTYLLAALGTKGEVKVNGIQPEHLNIVISKMREMGAGIETGENWIKLKMDTRVNSMNFVTYPYPGFPTDLQAATMAVLTTAEGTSSVRETIFENRFLHVMELLRLGANITISGDTCTVTGVSYLDGAEVMASDIRAGAGLVIAGLMAKGKTEILRIYHIDRGYEALEKNLNALGANIQRVPQ
ncbi:UDP-N-acetylglucosamine 1-carboxyvinyltransferase [bacterium]|nr:UDP-N-acetylglucosamine 1-carboxyvinyltransferase [bacterium]